MPESTGQCPMRNAQWTMACLRQYLCSPHFALGIVQLIRALSS
jgi:hypothetical protein